MSKLTFDEILSTPVDQPRVGGDLTIKGYLHRLLVTLWSEEDAFSGKRPFGDSGWSYDLYKPLVVCGAIKGDICPEYGDLEEFDQGAADKLVFKLIDHIFK